MMTPDVELAMHDAMLDCLDASDRYVVEQQMTSALLALCHAQQVEIAELKAQRAMDREDIKRMTRYAVR